MSKNKRVFNTSCHVVGGKHGDFTMSAVKLIVSDYRYFLLTIYDIRFTQITGKQVFKPRMDADKHVT